MRDFLEAQAAPEALTLIKGLASKFVLHPLFPRFYYPDFWQEKFKDCRMENTTFLHPKKGCHLNFHEENDIVIYMVSFLGSLSVLPGNIISALFMDKMGRIRVIGEISKVEHK